MLVASQDLDPSTVSVSCIQPNYKISKNLYEGQFMDLEILKLQNYLPHICKIKARILNLILPLLYDLCAYEGHLWLSLNIDEEYLLFHVRRICVDCERWPFALLCSKMSNIFRPLKL